MERRPPRVRFLAAASLVAFVFSCLFIVWCRQRTVQLGYRIEQLRKTRRELLDQRRSLEAEIASLRAPARIEKLAREDLGMHFPRPHEIVNLAPRSEGVVARGPGGKP